jgi:hypothetical protein
VDNLHPSVLAASEGWKVAGGQPPEVVALLYSGRENGVNIVCTVVAIVIDNK